MFQRREFLCSLIFMILFPISNAIWLATHFDKEMLQGSLKTNPGIKGGMGLESRDLVFKLPCNIGMI
jgi:hypothetical protein